MNRKPFEFSLNWLIGSVITTVRRPKDGAAMIVGLGLSTQALWQMLALVVAVSVILGQGTLLLTIGDGQLSNPYLANPLLMAALQMFVLLIMVAATFQIGRLMGGTGSFQNTMALVTWLQIIMVTLQVVQTLLMFLMPPVADVIGLLGLGLFLWLFTNFVAQLHGFRSLAMVFVMILVSALGLAFVVSIALAVLGFSNIGVVNV